MSLSKLPHHMQEEASNYIERGYRPGAFLRHILKNDLIGAASHADGVNRYCLYEWACWLYNSVPVAAKGSDEAIDNWCKSGGLNAQCDQR